jgi:uncharacterized protein (DUF433 family)
MYCFYTIIAHLDADQLIREEQLLQDYPTLSVSDLANAWFYASMYPQEIALAIQENEEA